MTAKNDPETICVDSFFLHQIHENDSDWRDAWLKELDRRERDVNYLPAKDIFGKYRKPTT